MEVTRTHPGWGWGWGEAKNLPRREEPGSHLQRHVHGRERQREAESAAQLPQGGVPARPPVLFGSPPPTLPFPHLCHLQQESLHNIARRPGGVQVLPVLLHLLDSEGSQGAQVAEELCVGAGQELQEPGEYLVGLPGEGQLFPPGPGPGQRAGGQGALGSRKRQAGAFGGGGWSGILCTYLAPRGADPHYGAAGRPDHSLELLIVVGEAAAKDEGADDVGGGLGQQQGRVKWPSWVQEGREGVRDGDGQGRSAKKEWGPGVGMESETETDRQGEIDRQGKRDWETDPVRERDTERDTDWERERQTRRERQRQRQT